MRDAPVGSKTPDSYLTRSNIFLVVVAGIASAGLFYFGTGLAILRAVENGFALARSARNGLLTLSDNRGHILAEATTVPGRFASISGKVDVAQEKTFYTQTGDWFAWLCITAFLILLGCRFLSRDHMRVRTPEGECSN